MYISKIRAEGFKLCKNAVQNHFDFWTYGITTINKKSVAKNAHIGKCTYTEECTKEGTLEKGLETIAKE